MCWCILAYRPTVCVDAYIKCRSIVCVRIHTYSVKRNIQQSIISPAVSHVCMCLLHTHTHTHTRHSPSGPIQIFPVNGWLTWRLPAGGRALVHHLGTHGKGWCAWGKGFGRVEISSIFIPFHLFVFFIPSPRSEM